MKLGKLPATPARVRPMREMLGLARRGMVLPKVPAEIDRSGSVSSWPMLENDQIGDCTIAAVGHAAQLWTAEAGASRVMTNAEAESGYELFGYRPGDEASDRGANAQDVLTRWTGAGFRIGGVTDVLSGFCAINPRAQAEVMAGVAWLGVVYAGLALPLAAQDMEFDWELLPEGTTLAGDWAPGNWGGHAVPLIGYGPAGVLTVTWGKTLHMSWPFWRAYADEAYGLLSKDFASIKIAAQSWQDLEAEMAALRLEAAA